MDGGRKAKDPLGKGRRASRLDAAGADEGNPAGRGSWKPTKGRRGGGAEVVVLTFEGGEGGTSRSPSARPRLPSLLLYAIHSVCTLGWLAGGARRKLAKGRRQASSRLRRFPSCLFPPRIHAPGAQP